MFYFCRICDDSPFAYEFCKDGHLVSVIAIKKNVFAVTWVYKIGEGVELIMKCWVLSSKISLVLFVSVVSVGYIPYFRYQRKASKMKYSNEKRWCTVHIQKSKFSKQYSRLSKLFIYRILPLIHNKLAHAYFKIMELQRSRCDAHFQICAFFSDFKIIIEIQCIIMHVVLSVFLLWWWNFILSSGYISITLK